MRSHRLLTLLPLILAALSAPAAGQDPLTRQALGRIEEVEKKAATLPEGDVKAANLLLNSLEWAGKRLNAVGDKSEPKWQEAKQRHDDVRAKIEAKAKAAAPKPAAGAFDHAKLAQLDKEIAAALGNFKQLSVKHLADPFRSGSTQKELDGFVQRLAGFPPGEAAVQAVATRLQEYQHLFAASMAQLRQDIDAGAATTQRLAALDAKYEAKNMPGEPSHPFEEEPLRAWASEIRRWREVEIPADLAFLQQSAANSAVDGQHVSRLHGWITEGWGRRLAEVERTVRDRIEADVQDGLRICDWILSTDAADRDQVANRILGEGAFDGNMMRLRQAEHAVAIARVHDAALPGKPAVDRDAQTAKVDQAIAHLQRLAVVCLDAVRMPKAASTDAELLRIAAETLKQPDYGVAAWERLVVNADKVRREAREGWIQPGAVSTTVAIHHYVWDEFQVTTAEKKGDEVWLFANQLKHYHSGDPTKPVGRWILSQRFPLTRILPENVAR